MKKGKRQPAFQSCFDEEMFRIYNLISKKIPKDHDKMILCQAVAHASIFSTPRQAFFFINRESFFVSFLSFKQ